MEGRKVESFVLMVALTAAIFSSVNPTSSENSKMSAKLQNRLEKATDTELIPVYIVLREVSTRNVMKEELAQYLKTETPKVQKPLLTYLNAYTSSGYQKKGISPDPKKFVEEIDILWISNVISLQATKQIILDLSKNAGVLRMNLNEPRYDVACYNPEAWGVSQVGAKQVWDTFGITGSGAVVAVIDTGVDWTHPDLNDHIWTNPGEDPWTDPNDPTTGNGIDDDGNGFIDDWRGWDFVRNNNDPMPRAADPLASGHGTQVAGTVAGDGTGGTTTGVAPEAQIMIVRTIVGGTETDCWEGIQYAVDNGADVINMSLGWFQMWGPDNVTWRTVCVNAINAGVVMAVAAGNEDNWVGVPENLRTPGIIPEVITVGATDNADLITWFSSVGPVDQFSDYPYPPGLLKPDVVAPGDGINSTLWGGGYSGNTLSGTSMAAPHVAGAAALIRSKFPGVSHFEIKQALKITALKLPTPFQSPNNEYGYGRIDIYRAILYLSLRYPPQTPLDSNKAMMPRAASAIRNARDLLESVQQKCKELEQNGDPLYDKCCKDLEEIAILIEKAEKFYLGGNYIAANYFAMEAMAKLKEIVDCCTK